MANPVYIRSLGRVPYEQTLREMQAFTAARTAATTDEIWLLEHPPVYTLGINAAADHILDPGNTPVVRTDRGGQVTWHGPGQLVIYLLLDLRRNKLGVRRLVCAMETAVIRCLAGFGIEAQGRPGAPGVYVDAAKIASLGLRVRHHCSYHGLAVNVNPDLQDFAGINPCGYEGLAVTRSCDLGGPASLADMTAALLPELLRELDLRRSTA